MTRQVDSKIWTNRSQKINGNVMVTFPDLNTRLPKTVHRVKPVPVQYANTTIKTYPKHYEEFFVVDKEKAAQTGRWVLNVIARKEADHQAKIVR